MLSIRRLFGLEPQMQSGLPGSESKRTLAQALVDRGVAAEESGATDAALRYYREALGVDPKFAYAHMCLGIALQATGEPVAAVESLSQAAALEPDYAPAHYNLALACLLTGAIAQADAEFRASLELRPDFPEAWVGLAEALEARGRDTEALAALETAITQRKHYAGALFNASLLLRKMGRIEQAEARLHEIDLTALYSAGRHAETEAAARQMIQAWPEYGFGWKVLGAVLGVSRRYEEAVPALQRALETAPLDAEAHHNLAIVLHALGRLSEAEASYLCAIQLRPAYPEAHNNLGNLLQAFGRFAEAETCCLRAIELNPDFFEAHSDLGNILEATGRQSEALASYRRALVLKPDYHLAHNNLGAALVALGRLSEAESSCRRALELQPNFREGHDNLLFLLNYHPDKSPKEVYSAYQEFDARFGLPLRTEWRVHTNARQPEKRLRIGYVSPDFRRHAAAHFIAPLLDHHSKSAVEVFAYAEVAIEDEVTARLKSSVDRWISTCGMNDAQMADRIRADGIDILVDLAGHTRRNRLPVFARKPAPVSLTTIGFGYTTGLTAIDWFLTDGIVVPEGAENNFSEKPWRIPLCQVYRPADDMGPVNALPALERGHVTFGTLTRAARINRRIVRVWSDILRRVPGSRLRIDSLNFRDPALCEALAVQFSVYGISGERLEMGFHSPPWDVMREIDICLDCFPQNSGTTLFESLYMGIPFITLADRPSLGRLGASIASHVGHPEWTADTEEEYARKAVALASDPQRLSTIRAGLREEMRASTLMDEAAYVRQVEAAYHGMWRIWCSR